MATHGDAGSNSKGEYGNVPLGEEEDIVQLKKSQSLQPLDGWRNHPGASRRGPPDKERASHFPSLGEY